MGPTGTGKSSFIQRLTGDQSIEIGHGVETVTSEIKQYNYDVGGRWVTFVDFPAFDDSREGATDTDILQKIAAFLEREFNNDKKLSGIIYLHRITDARMGGVLVRNLRTFQKLCGNDALTNVLIVTTRWDDVQERDRATMEKREKELTETPGKFFEPLIAAGGRFHRHDNTTGSAQRIVEEVLKNRPIPLQIQLEMRDGKTVEETTAGSEVAAEMRNLSDRHGVETANLRRELEEANAAKDEAVRELDAERANIEETRNILDGHAIERANLRRELEEANAAKDQALRELDAERANMQRETTRWEEQKQGLADGLAEAERRLSGTPPWGIWVRSGGILDFMRTLYQNILDRDPESQEVLEWHARNTYTHGLANAVGGFFMSPEYASRGLSAEATVDRYYLSLLGRQPEAQGREYWVGEIQRGMTLWRVAEGFVGSEEYRRRVDAQMAPDPIHWPGS